MSGYLKIGTPIIQIEEKFMTDSRKIVTKRTRSNASGSAKRVTLSDVAKLADVSTMTVSKVIRKTGSISAPTRDRVNEAIEKLGYLPNLIAGSLSSQVNLMVAVIIPNLGTNVFGEVLRGINTSLTGAGMHTFIGASDYHTDIEEELIRTMLAWQPCGLILTGGVTHSATTNRLLAAKPCPIIKIWDNDVLGFDVNIGFSHIEAGRIVARHFRDKGFRKIGYVGAQHGKDVCAARRYRGFCDQLDEFGLSVVAQIAEDNDRETPDGMRGTAELLARTRDLDAIYYLNDAMAIGGMTQLYREGFKTPEQIAVAGFNGSSKNQLISTELTTVDTARWLIGDTAARSLLDLIAGKDVASQIDIKPQLIQGNTT